MSSVNYRDLVYRKYRSFALLLGFYYGNQRSMFRVLWFRCHQNAVERSAIGMGYEEKALLFGDWFPKKKDVIWNNWVVAQHSTVRERNMRWAREKQMFIYRSRNFWPLETGSEYNGGFTGRRFKKENSVVNSKWISLLCILRGSPNYRSSPTGVIGHQSRGLHGKHLRVKILPAERTARLVVFGY